MHKGAFNWNGDTIEIIIFSLTIYSYYYFKLGGPCLYRIFPQKNVFLRAYCNVRVRVGARSGLMPIFSALK